MAKLIFGVDDVAYSDAAAGGGLTTTGAVASILEARYAPMETFYELRKGKIVAILEESMGHALQDLLNGRPTTNPGYGAGQQIEREFRSFIYANEMQKLSLAMSGQPISAAAARGIRSGRKLNPYAKKNRPRPAFVDTGLYVQSFRARLIF
jgi:hypothetical protein